MAQIIVTPHWVYKAFRNLIIGYNGALGEDHYIEESIGTTIIKPLKYFKVGDRGGVAFGGEIEISRNYFDLNIKDKNSGKGDLVRPLPLYAGGGGPIGGDAYKKPLVAGDFYQYGSTADSRVSGVLGVEPDESGDPGYGKYYNIPGAFFQVNVRIEQAEGNRDYLGNPVVPPAAVYYNEIGLYDEDDILCAYGVFNNQAKNAEIVSKFNVIAMLKTLDWRLYIVYGS
jgi:hypothetical protein